MAFSIGHDSSPDASFSAAGASAWSAVHTVSGTIPSSLLESAWPIGSIYIEITGTNPATTFGFGTWSLFAQGKTIFGIQTGSAEFGTAGQTGGATGVSITPSGTNSTVSFTPSGTLDLGLYIPNGTLAPSAVTGTVSVDWPTGVPVFAGTTATVSMSVNWPAGVPTFAGTAHQHEVPLFSTGATGFSILSGAVFGVTGARAGNLRVSATATGPIVLGPGAGSTVGTGSVMLAGSTTAAGVISWPASVPQAVQSVGFTPAGVITWPATAPAAMAKTLTAAAQIFTGATGSGSAIFSGVAGTIPAQTFTGIARTADKLPPYIVTFLWQRTA